MEAANDYRVANDDQAEESLAEALRLSLAKSKHASLFLVDLGAIYWHAWHSSNRDMTPDEPAEATLSRVRRWAEEYPKIGICCDDPSGTWRHELYIQYKATRTEKPPGASAQLARAIAVLKREGYPVWLAPNHEGDDVLASAARLAANRGIDVVIATADKDMMQLVCDRISILRTNTGTLMRAPEVKAKYGVRPEQIGDWLAIVGDASDNVPGVKGIGAKGAADLLTQYGFISQILGAAKDPGTDMRAKTRAALIDGEVTLGLARRLVSLVETLDIPIDEALSRELAPRLPEAEEPEEEDQRGEFVEFGDAIPERSHEIAKEIIDTNERIIREACDVAIAAVTARVSSPPPQPAPEPPQSQPGRIEKTMATQAPNGTTNGTTHVPVRKARNAVVKGAPKQPHAIILTGRSGIGKTYLASTVPTAFFICVEQGLKGASPEHVDSIARFDTTPRRFQDLLDDIQDFRENYAKQGGHGHLIIDSITGVEKLVNKQACNQENVQHMAAKDFNVVWVAAVPHWQKLQDELDKVRAIGVHVWLIAHSSEVTESVGETGETWVKYDLQFQGSGKALASLRNMWRAWADHVLFIDWDARVLKAKSIGTKAVGKYDARILRTRETPQHYAKNRANLPPVLAASWVDLKRAMQAGAAGSGPAPDAKLRERIAAILPQVPDDGDREGLTAEMNAAPSGAALSAILSRAQGLIAAARSEEDEPAAEPVQQDEGTVNGNV